MRGADDDHEHAISIDAGWPFGGARPSAFLDRAMTCRHNHRRGAGFLARRYVLQPPLCG
jgi:hypothetical protein